MPIAAQCNDCGKKYLVASAMAGKRAKCKACGHVFRIGPAAPKLDQPPKPAEKAKVADKPNEAYSHDLGIAGAFAKPPPAAL